MQELGAKVKLKKTLFSKALSNGLPFICPHIFFFKYHFFYKKSKRKRR